MNPAVFNWGSVAVIVGCYLLGIYFNSRGIAQVNKRIDDLRSGVNHRLNDVNYRISDLKDFVHSEILRVEDRIDRLKRPVLHS